MIVSEIKARLREINYESNTKWPVSGVKDTLISRLGWAELPALDFASDIFSDTPQAQNGPKLLDFPRKGPIIKRIPKASRHQVCVALTKVLSEVIKDNSPEAWSKFFWFTREILYGKSRAGRKKKSSLASIVNKRVISFNEGKLQGKSSSSPGSVSSQDKSSGPTLAEKVSEKLSQFDMKGAIRLICSTDKVLEPSEEVLDSLKDKHPSPFEPRKLPEPPSDEDNVVVSKLQVEASIRSFKSGAAGGPDGLTPQHLKDLTSKELGQAATSLLETITNLLNQIIITGKIPGEVCEIFYGASLMALSKTCGGIRPIAIGFTFRRLAGKVLMSTLKGECSDLFHSHQLGVGTALGTEIAVHSIRQYINNPDSTDKVILKVDFRNAFNCLRRDVMLSKVKELRPKIFNYVWQAYSSQTNLTFGEDIVLSREGVQQGDPLGPFLFALGIADLTRECTSEFNCWYLDDGTIGGTVAQVLEDYDKILAAGNSLGLAVNPSKTELLLVKPVHLNPNDVLDQFNQLTPGIKLIKEEDLTLLGAPINVEGISKVLKPKLESLELMCSRLGDLDRHEATFLLRNAFNIPKLNYFLRTAPCFLENETLAMFDDTLHTSIQKILNVKMDDNAWSQASLPLCYGALGI